MYGLLRFPLVVLGFWLAGEGLVLAADVKVACVGDSITFGYGASAGKVYPAVLSTLLGAGWNVRNFGNSGKTMIKKPSDGASYWDQTEFTQSQAFAPDVVVLMLGTNDSKSANWKSGNNTYAADYAAMVAVYAALATKPTIYAMLPPPALSSSFNISGDVIQKEILPVIRSVAAQTGIGVIDLNAAILASDPKALLGTDGIHPNDAGYAFIAATVAAVLETRGQDGGTRDGGGSDGSTSAGGKGGGGISGGGIGGSAGTSAGGRGGGTTATGGSGGVSPGATGGMSGKGMMGMMGMAGGGGVEGTASGGRPGERPDAGLADAATSADGGGADRPGAGSSSGCTCEVSSAPRGGIAALLLLGWSLGRRRSRPA